MVAPEYLMQGAHYALEQCGHLLHDAMALFHSGSYPTASVLAAFAWEELGKARELRQMHREVLAGTVLTVEDVRRRCKCGHVVKQERGQVSIVMRFPTDSELGEIVRARATHHPRTEEWKRASARLEEITAEHAIRIPGERHETRLSCLYVDPDETGTTWNRPRDQPREEARRALEDAANDYAGHYDHYHRGNVGEEDDEFIEALRRWTGRPELPAPEWP
jgi:AbiV family abortive infection protein